MNGEVVPHEGVHSLVNLKIFFGNISRQLPKLLLEITHRFLRGHFVPGENPRKHRSAQEDVLAGVDGGEGLIVGVQDPVLAAARGAGRKIHAELTRVLRILLLSVPTDPCKNLKSSHSHLPTICKCCLVRI